MSTNKSVSRRRITAGQAEINELATQLSVINFNGVPFVEALHSVNASAALAIQASMIYDEDVPVPEIEVSEDRFLTLKAIVAIIKSAMAKIFALNPNAAAPQNFDALRNAIIDVLNDLPGDSLDTNEKKKAAMRKLLQACKTSYRFAKVLNINIILVFHRSFISYHTF